MRGIVPHLLRLDREAADLMQEIMTIKLAAEMMLLRLKIEVTCGYTLAFWFPGLDNQSDLIPRAVSRHLSQQRRTYVLAVI